MTMLPSLFTSPRFYAAVGPGVGVDVGVDVAAVSGSI